jgi:hypothetical protein
MAPARGTISGPHLRALSEIEIMVFFVFEGCPQGNALCVRVPVIGLINVSNSCACAQTNVLVDYITS